MAWFHKTLGDMLVAIDKEDWETAKKILNQHLELSYSAEIEHSLRLASVNLNEYWVELRNLQALIGHKGMKNPKIPVGARLTGTKVSVKKAQDSIRAFELIIQKLVKEGKLEE